MEYLGFGLALLIGVTLGLIGGGGSILTVPVLVYVMHIDPLLATAYSLFIVGSTSLFGAVRYAFNKLLDYRTALFFGIPSILAVFMDRKWVVPSMPKELFSIGGLTVTKTVFVMMLFAVLMVFASISMIKKKKNNKPVRAEKGFNYPLIMGEGFLIGSLTGLVGAGGGFLIIPALVIFAGLEIKMAIGTSLLIIAANSLIGFTGDLSHQTMDWLFLAKFTAFAVVGIFMGTALSKKISGEKLRPAFGWFVLVMGVYIIVAELFFK